MALTSDDKKMLRKFVTSELERALARLETRRGIAFDAAARPTAEDAKQIRLRFNRAQAAQNKLTDALTLLKSAGFVVENPNPPRYGYASIDSNPIRFNLALADDTKEIRRERSNAIFHAVKEQMHNKARQAQLDIIAADIPGMDVKLQILKDELTALADGTAKGKR